MDDQTCKWVALLRGVNVGGANRVPMADLRVLADGLGWRNVRSYIASGNLVFDAGKEDHAERLRAVMVAEMGVDVPILVLPADEVVSALAGCPYEDAGNLVHVAFCWKAPVVDTALCDMLIAADERLAGTGRVAYLHAPSGVARSKLMARLEDVLGVSVTARNLNTLRKLAGMVQA